jgi:uncharacterized protein (TIGR03435 family)
VSVKPNTSGATGGTMQSPPGRVIARNISLRMLIRNAFGVLDSQIVSGLKLVTPDYLAAQKFDIEGTYSGEQASRDELNGMVRAMLADRFKLVVHRETREMQVFALTMARPDRQLGPQLRLASDADCPPPAGRESGPPPAPRAGGPGPESGRAAGPEQGRGPAAQAAVPCGALQFSPGRYRAHGVPLDQLVNSLSNQSVLTGIDRAVLDRTGLMGRFDFDLQWQPQGRAGGPAADGQASDAPSLFTALQEQLGLKLEPQRAPLEVLVIDSVQLPEPN